MHSVECTVHYFLKGKHKNTGRSRKMNSEMSVLDFKSNSCLYVRLTII